VTTCLSVRVHFQAFEKFDQDGSGLLEQDEFEGAMHVLGLRLTKDEYLILFKEYDVDGSGAIDLEEFSHMVKKTLRTPCDAEHCRPCTDSRSSPISMRTRGSTCTAQARTWPNDSLL